MSKIHFNQEQPYLYLTPLALLSVATIMRKSRVSVNPSSSLAALRNASMMHQTRSLQASAAHASGSFSSNNSSTFYGDREEYVRSEVYRVMEKQQRAKKYDPVLSVAFFIVGYVMMYCGDSAYKAIMSSWKARKNNQKK